jgi:hypothetical protein
MSPEDNFMNWAAQQVDSVVPSTPCPVCQHPIRDRDRNDRQRRALQKKREYILRGVPPEPRAWR